MELTGLNGDKYRIKKEEIKEILEKVIMDKNGIHPDENGYTIVKYGIKPSILRVIETKVEIERMMND